MYKRQRVPYPSASAAKAAGWRAPGLSHPAAHPHFCTGRAMAEHIKPYLSICKYGIINIHCCPLVVPVHCMGAHKIYPIKTTAPKKDHLYHPGCCNTFPGRKVYRDFFCNFKSGFFDGQLCVAVNLAIVMVPLLLTPKGLVQYRIYLNSGVLYW